MEKSPILRLKTVKCILRGPKECTNVLKNSVALILETILNFGIEAQSVLFNENLPDENLPIFTQDVNTLKAALLPMQEVRNASF